MCRWGTAPSGSTTWPWRAARRRSGGGSASAVLPRRGSSLRELRPVGRGGRARRRAAGLEDPAAEEVVRKPDGVRGPYLRTMRYLFFSMLLALFAHQASPSPQAGPVVIELFTSQGCSSCPPADRLLSKLAGDPRYQGKVIPLSFHVDYWNYIGWQDPFSSARWSDRQQRLRRPRLPQQPHLHAAGGGQRPRRVRGRLREPGRGPDRRRPGGRAGGPGEPGRRSADAGRPPEGQGGREARQGRRLGQPRPLGCHLRERSDRRR